MGIYFEIIRFHFLRYLAYPIEIWAVVIRRLIFIAGLLIFWGIIAKSSEGTIPLKPLLSYFLIAGGVSDLTSAEAMRFAKFVGDSIKYGRLNTFIIRPLKLIPYMYASSIGEQSLRLIMGVISMAIGLTLNPPRSEISILFFILFFGLAMIISISLNLIVGTIHFYTAEATAIRFTAGHVIKVCAGGIIPLTFFPEHTRRLLMLTPFPAMIFGPVQSLHYDRFSGQVSYDLIVGSVWALSLLLLSVTWWRHAIKAYDAVGI